MNVQTSGLPFVIAFYPTILMKKTLAMEEKSGNPDSFGRNVIPDASLASRAVLFLYVVAWRMFGKVRISSWKWAALEDVFVWMNTSSFLAISGKLSQVTRALGKREVRRLQPKNNIRPKRQSPMQLFQVRLLSKPAHSCILCELRLHLEKMRTFCMQKMCN